MMPGATRTLPEPVRVLETRQETHDVTTLTFDGHAPFRAGQFNMLYALGVGEVPISMSGDPTAPGALVHTIRAVGAVTEALCRLQPGSTIGVRGPYGRPWPLEHATGADLILIAGGLGLAPLRPVVYQVLAQRERFGQVALLVGARTPDDLLFRRELEHWKAQAALDVRITVDRAAPGWKERVGVVPALLSELGMRVEQTLAFLCGPEVMMRFCVRELLRHALPKERIYLALERNMKCAVGFCGHCQYGPHFVCKDGPVMRYDEISALFWRREV